MRKNEIAAGITGGILTIVLFLVIYAMEPRWMLSPALYWGSSIFYLLAMLGACLLQKRAGNGLLSFRNALRTGFVAFLVANALFYVFYFLMFNSIDPDLPLLQKETMREYYQEVFRGPELQEQLAALEKENFNLEASDLFFGFCRGAIGGFILSLLLALVVRQDA